MKCLERSVNFKQTVRGRKSSVGERRCRRHGRWHLKTETWQFGIIQWRANENHCGRGTQIPFNCTDSWKRHGHEFIFIKFKFTNIQTAGVVPYWENTDHHNMTHYFTDEFKRFGFISVEQKEQRRKRVNNILDHALKTRLLHAVFTCLHIHYKLLGIRYNNMWL